MCAQHLPLLLLLPPGSSSLVKPGPLFLPPLPPSKEAPVVSSFRFSSFRFSSFRASGFSPFFVFFPGLAPPLVPRARCDGHSVTPDHKTLMIIPRPLERKSAIRRPPRFAFAKRGEERGTARARRDKRRRSRALLLSPSSPLARRLGLLRPGPRRRPAAPAPPQARDRRRVGRPPRLEALGALDAAAQHRRAHVVVAGNHREHGSAADGGPGEGVAHLEGDGLALAVVRGRSFGWFCFAEKKGDCCSVESGTRAAAVATERKRDDAKKTARKTRAGRRRKESKLLTGKSRACPRQRRRPRPAGRPWLPACLRDAREGRPARRVARTRSEEARGWWGSLGAIGTPFFRGLWKTQDKCGVRLCLRCKARVDVASCRARLSVCAFDMSVRP